jgi:hypothetical protein
VNLNTNFKIHFFFVVQQPIWPSPTHWSFYITHSVGLPWRSDQLIAEATTYTTHNKHNRWTSMPSVWFRHSSCNQTAADILVYCGPHGHWNWPTANFTNILFLCLVKSKQQQQKKKKKNECVFKFLNKNLWNVRIIFKIEVGWNCDKNKHDIFKFSVL